MLVQEKKELKFTGYTGFRGFTGFQGFTGAQGFTGFQGSAGSVGSAGQKGEPGSVGQQELRDYWFPGFSRFGRFSRTKGERFWEPQELREVKVRGNSNKSNRLYNDNYVWNDDTSVNYQLLP